MPRIDSALSRKIALRQSIEHHIPFSLNPSPIDLSVASDNLC